MRLQEKSGKIVEYYDIRNGKTADYGLNINDNTPLLILALWHHYNATGDEDFLREVYPAAAKAARYILSQRNEQGLVWCTATGTSDWGIMGWRNVIPNYRLSGATTEVNAECYAALRHRSPRWRACWSEHDESAEFARAGRRAQEAINTHLANPDNGLYYLQHRPGRAAAQRHHLRPGLPGDVRRGRRGDGRADHQPPQRPTISGPRPACAPRRAMRRTTRPTAAGACWAASGSA